MTPREFLAVAVMLSTNYDERQMMLAEQARDNAPDAWGRGFWSDTVDDHAQCIGVKRALWLEANG